MSLIVYANGSSLTLSDDTLDGDLSILTHLRPFADGTLVRFTPSGPEGNAMLLDEKGIAAAALLAGLDFEADWLEVPRGHADGPTIDTLVKHYGPGAHPGTGTSQEAHAGRITVGRGEGTLNKAPVVKYLVDAKGNELLPSFATLGKAHILIDGKVQPAEDIRQKVKDAIKGAGEKTTDLERNLQMVMDSALARYADDPTLIDKDRFYEMWHEVLSDIAIRHGIPLDDVVAASALISPGLKAYHNILYANDLATWIAEDVGWEGTEAARIKAILKKTAHSIHNPVWKEGQKGVEDGLHKIGDPKEPPKPGSFRWNQGQMIYDDLAKIGTSFKVSDLSDYSAAFALSAHRARVGGLNIEGLPEALVGKYKFPKGGFSAKNTGFFASAIGVLRGTTTPDEALGDVKTRSFFNNILDPEASGSFGDVTVDYHMADAAFMSNRFGRDNTREQDLIASPAIEGVGVGVRPLIADHVRTVAARTVVNGEQLTPLRAQEILWAEWARGMRGTGKEKVTHWEDYSTGKRWKLGA